MKFTLAVCFLGLSQFALAQSPYRVTWPKALPVVAAGGITGGVSILLNQKNTPLTTAQLAHLKAENLPRFDRFATRKYSSSAKKASDILLYSSPLWPTLLLIDPKIRANGRDAMAISGQAVMLSAGLTALTKELALRPRPYTYNPTVPMSLKTGKDARKSFFSGHTSTLAAFSFSAAKIWCDHHPDSRKKPWVWAGATALPLCMGGLRVGAGKHFPSDVFVGMIVGGACGVLVPRLMQKR